MQHKVIIGRDSKFYGLNRDMFEEGEKVEFKILFARDVSTRPVTDDASIVQTNYDACYNYYSFTMPDHDVNIQIFQHNDMMRNPTDITQTPEPNNNTGFMGMGFMMKKPEEASKEEKVSTKKFCTFCGEKIM